MSNKILFIFVEGQDDEQFVNAFIRDNKCLLKKYKTIRCIPYAEGMTPTKINKSITSIKKSGHDYIFLGDADFDSKINCFPEKKRDLKKKYNLPDENRIWIVIQAIESWFLAGFDKLYCKKEKIKFIPNTERIKKEDFIKIARTKYGNKKTSPAQLKNLLKRHKAHFSFKQVVDRNRNQSLARFYNHFELDCG